MHGYSPRDGPTTRGIRRAFLAQMTSTEVDEPAPSGRGKVASNHYRKGHKVQSMRPANQHLKQHWLPKIFDKGEALTHLQLALKDITACRPEHFLPTQAPSALASPQAEPTHWDPLANHLSWGSSQRIRTPHRRLATPVQSH